MKIYCLIDSNNVVVNKIEVTNPVAKEQADVLVDEWKAAVAAWETNQVDENGDLIPRPTIVDHWTIPNGITLGDGIGNIGDTWDGQNYITPPPPTPPAAPVPRNISDRQFFQGCAIAGYCTEAEALSAVKTGDLPSTLQSFINQLPTEQQFSATMLLSGATTFDRQHALTDAFGVMYGLNSEQLDDFWRMCASL